MSDRYPQLFLGLLSLSIALVIGALAVGSAVRDVKLANDQVTVTGSARRPIRSDFALWRVSVTSQSATLEPASVELARNSERVRAWLRAQAIADTMVTMRPIETFAIPEVFGEGRETGRIAGYRLTQSFEIRSRDVDGITRLSQRSAELISQGIPLVAAAPEYMFTGLAEMRVALLADATRDARARAVVIAESAGGEVGTVREARMGVFQITPRFSTEVSDYGINDVSAIDKDVTAVVRVTFGIR